MLLVLHKFGRLYFWFCWIGPTSRDLTIELKVLSLKLMLLLALACVKKDFKVIFMDTACLEFGKHDCVDRLQPGRGYVPKAHST